MNTERTTYCAYVGFIGRPNVGKSTLMNHLLGKKISITSRKPQTTRHRLLGILTQGDRQFVFVDTPGIHPNLKSALNKAMNQAAQFAIGDVDILVVMFDARSWNDEDDKIISSLRKLDKPIICLLNKVDVVDNQNQLLPRVKHINQALPNAEVIPISALHNKNLDKVLASIIPHMPQSPFYFPPEMVSDRTDSFLISEIIREKVFRSLGQEIPYSAAVCIDKLKQEKEIMHISATILVEREGQKKIIIGKQGAALKKIGQAARLDIEKHLKQKVFLELWVKVKRNWSNLESELRDFGYRE